MDIFSYSRQQSGTYKSPRHPHQASDHNMKTEENDMTKRLHQISAGPSPNAARLFQAIIKEAGNPSKDRDSNLVPTSKVLKNVVNRNHLLDSNTTKDYDVEYFIEQGQKLPIISKKFLPKIDTNKKSDRLAKVEADMYATHQSLTRKAPKQNHNSPSPVKHQKDTWRSAIKYASEEREYLIDGKSGKFSSKNHESGSVINPNIGMRARFSSGALKLMHNNNLSAGEEEESNGDTLGFSLMISPVKGSKRAAQNLKKRTEVVRQIRVGSPEQKDKSIDYSELKKAKTRIERQNAEAKKSQKKRNLQKASSSVFQDIRRVEGETEGSYSKESDDEEDVEEKKMGYESKDEDNMTKRKEEKDKAKYKPVPIGLRKGVPSQAGKESKAESTVAIVSKQSKKLADHILISKVGDKEKESVQMKREQAYKEFMLQLNFSFNIQVKVPTEKTFVAYKYFLGKGNNSMMLKALMKQRWWWVQVDNKEASDINFMWTQLKQNKFIDGLKQKRKSPFDNLEWSGVSSHCNNGNDTTVATTTSFIDSITDCDSDTTEGETKITTVKKTRKSHSTTHVSGKASIKKDLNDPRKTQEDATTAAYKKLFTNQEIMLMNSITGGKGNAILYPEDCEEIGRLRKGPAPQLVADPSVMKMCNHLESNYHLANKKALLWNMKSYYEATKQNVFDFLPLTFHVRNGFEDKEYQKFVEYYNNREKEIQEQEKLAQETKESKKERAAKKLRNIWIVKPGENTNRGVGIHVCDSLSQINDLVATTQGNTDGKKRTYLIQQYLDKPLLYNKRKFDIRCYILMTCINGMMKGYWYQDGYIRTASKEFSLKNVTNKFIHLTNDAVQKKAEEYGKFESGNKLSYNDFQKYLDAHHDGNINFASDIYPQIKQLATDAIKGVYGKIDPYRRENSFEVFGLDFMIDTNLRAWLIEVNTNPDINASSPVLTRVIPPMVENALRLTIDQMYPPPAWQTSKKQMLPENLLENNKFELVFDEVEDGPALRSILQADKGATGDLILEIVAEEEEEDAEEEAKD